MNQNESNENAVERQAIKKQKEQKQNDMLAGIIDNESKTYTFDYTVSMGTQKKKGTFVAKYMGVAARLRIGTIRAKLLDGAPSQSVDTLTDDIAYMIAYLQVALIKTPTWWGYDQMDDLEDLKGIYMEVYKFIQSFRIQNDSNTDAGDSSVTTSQEDVENQ